MDSKLFGGILLILGTAIGGGMLALPIATTEIGFLNAFFYCLAVGL
jgi:tyrosine-specific transport protein